MGVADAELVVEEAVNDVEEPPGLNTISVVETTSEVEVRLLVSVTVLPALGSHV